MHVAARQIQPLKHGNMILLTRPTDCAVLVKCNRKGALLLLVYAMNTVHSKGGKEFCQPIGIIAFY
jgi:hypothetical protein